MTQGAFSRILARYGQNVTVYTQDVPQGIRTRAFFQPQRDKGTEQSVPTPLGWAKQDRFLYLGPADIPLDGACKVKVGEEMYQARSVQPIYAGDRLTYWWAVFANRAREGME